MAFPLVYIVTVFGPLNLVILANSSEYRVNQVLQNSEKDIEAEK